MSDMLLGLSSEYIYNYRKPPKNISEYHRPYFLAFCPKEKNIEIFRKDLVKKWGENKSDENQLSKIEKIGDVEKYRSFWDFKETRNVFKIYTKRSYFVPEVSDYLFFNHGLYTAEHDIPYHQRALLDLAAGGKTWLFDTDGQKKKLKVLIYDIETTQFDEGKTDVPIDIVGYSDFDIVFESKKNLDDEEFSFDILDCPSFDENIEVKQIISRNVDEEIDNLYEMCKVFMDYDVVSGHNILGFDNFQVYGRINWILKNHRNNISGDKTKVFEEFINRFARLDKSFHFGSSSEVANFYPCSFDTYHGARKFYSFLDEFGLKPLAQFLGVRVKDRVFLTPSQIKIDQRTLKYNRHDVIEQMGVTIDLIQQALPLAFTTCMTFDNLLSSGAVYMWDHMSLLRGAMQKKIMPPICRVKSVSQVLVRDFRGCKTRSDIVKTAKMKKEKLSKDFVRVLKYGDEMPEWVEYPYVVYNENAKDSDDILNYHIPGGMTIKPDKEAHSHFIPWYHVVVADVGAMYPTILKAMNVGGDTVRLSTRSETPDEWIWLKKLPRRFLENGDVNWRDVDSSDSFADEGYMLGVKIDKKPGVVNLAMSGIMSLIAKTKKELKDVKTQDDKSELQRLKMMYQSVKGARNAGSVDYSQRISLIDSEGYISNIKIGEFVDKAIIENGSRIKNINGTDFEVSDIKNNWFAISVNKEGTTEIKRVRQAVRHKWNEKLVKISTKSGYSIVTPNHSVFTIKNGKISEISAEDLDNDTLLVHAKKIPAIEKTININLIEEIQSPDYFAFIDKENLDNFGNIKDDLHNLNIKTNRTTPYLKIKLNDIKKLEISDELHNYITVGACGRKTSRIPAIIPIDEKLSELMGYYISEGHTSKKIVNGNSQFYITFSSASKDMHNRIKDISKEVFDKDVYTLNRMEGAKTIVSTLHAKVINYLFEKILKCGNNSRDKKIPSHILSSPLSVKEAFFKAYMDGDGNYKQNMPSSVPFGRFTTNSRYLNEDLIILQKQKGVLTNTYFRECEKTYNTRMVGYFKGIKESLGDCYAIPPKKIEFVDPTSDYVYDISVEDNENFIDANGGILLHNTHGILAAPGVSGRQFNVWGAAAITTKGQMILDDTLKDLEKDGIRVVYGDTDGIYLGCSRSIGNLPIFSESLGVSIEKNMDDWLTMPDKALSAIEKSNDKWRSSLNYPDFELEPEIHDGMIFVKHKNYLIFDSKNGKVEMITKGNNFKGSDKANIARKVLKQIMVEVLRENPRWDNEDDARDAVRNSIRSKTKDILLKMDWTKVDLDDLTLIQSVQPAKRYKVNQDGSTSVFGKRSQALEKLLGHPIKSRIKLKFVVTKKPLPGITKPSKSGVKPIDYMYPLDLLKDVKDIDLDWYKKMIENYIQGAFGLSDIELTEQTGLDAWM